MKRGIIGDRDWNENHFQFLMKACIKVSIVNPISWLLNNFQTAVSALAGIDEFSKFTSNLVETATCFHEWFNSVSPENEKLPLDWGGFPCTYFLKDVRYRQYIKTIIR